MDSRDIRPGRLYDELAQYWPIMSAPEEYAEEAAHWRSLLREKLGPGRHAALELGAGGGHNLSHLTAEIDAVAVDLSEAMLAICRRLNPGVPTHVGDMRSVRLDQTFDAVLIHDAITHLETEADLSATFATAAAHLATGGVVIASPDRFREDFRPPEMEHATRVVGDVRFTHFEYAYDPDPADTQIETVMTYLIESPEGLRIEHDRLIGGIFPRATWLRLMEAAGFASEIRSFPLESWPRPYELLVGVRR